MDVHVRPTPLVIALCAGAVLIACGPSPDPGAKPGATPTDRSSGVPAPSAGLFADTEWRLVEFQSMDDAVGVERPHDLSAYTMRLAGDGTVVMRLNCNRATGTWTAQPAADGDSGSFEFGPLAVTSALCPPPSLDERVASQAPYVRGYLLRDGRLYLSLMADGGIFVWEPARP